MSTDDPTHASERSLRPLLPCVHSSPARSMYGPGEHVDSQTILEAWGAPIATAACATVHDQSLRLRRRAPELGEPGLAFAAGITVTRCPTDRAFEQAGGGG
jgi:hypothetical protein